MMRRALRYLDVAPVALVAGVVVVASMLASLWLALEITVPDIAAVVVVATAALGVRLWLRRRG